MPVCQDSIGTTWLGVVVHGADAGRQVLMTVTGHGPDSLAVRPLLAAARREIKERHACRLALLDIELRPDAIAFVSESLEGEPLSTLIGTAAQEEERIPSAVALRIIREAAVALRELRRKSPLAWPHGLLNPETIFVASCGEVLLRQPATKAAALKVAGYATHPSFLSYVAPEMLRDDREDESCADVFSAGVLLWEMIAGRGLFGSPDSYRLGRVRGLSSGEAELVRQRILNEPVRSLSTLGLPGAAIPPDIARLVDWMLSPDPAVRPQSLSELVRVLDALSPASVASGPQLGHFVNRVLSDTLVERAKLAADAVTPQAPSQGVSVAPNSNRTSSSPPAFDEPNTLPRAAAFATRLAQEVPTIEEEPPPAAVVSIHAARRPARRDGFLAAAAGLLLIGGLGAYLLMERGNAREAAASDEVVIDEARQRVGTPRGVSSELQEAEKARRDAPVTGAETEVSESKQRQFGVPKPSQQGEKDRRATKKSSPSPSKTGYRPSGI